MAALCHVLFRSVLVYQSSSCDKILLADYPLVMIFHKILVHLSVIHTAMKGLIGKCFLKDCAACVILVFQNSENTGLAPALSARGGNLLRIQLPCDMSHAFPRKEISKNALYNKVFIGVNF